MHVSVPCLSRKCLFILILLLSLQTELHRINLKVIHANVKLLKKISYGKLFFGILIQIKFSIYIFLKFLLF